MRKNLVKCILILLIFDLNYVNAQENISDENLKVRFLGVEAGADPLFCMPPEYDFIRGDVLPYYYGGVSDVLRGIMFKEYLGIKGEFRNKTNRWGLLFGLRYTWLNASLGKENFYNTTSDFFYLLNNQSGTATEYFRINEINRNIQYLGVPVELRWLSNSQRIMKFYLKLGIELNYKIKSTSDVVFNNELMSANKDIVMAKFDKPGSFFSTMYLSGGFNFLNVPNIDLELILPYILLTPESSGILTSNSGMGFKIEIRLPY
jgi:hypothetical protein